MPSLVCPRPGPGNCQAPESWHANGINWIAHRPLVCSGHCHATSTMPCIWREKDREGVPLALLCMRLSFTTPCQKKDDSKDIRRWCALVLLGPAGFTLAPCAVQCCAGRWAPEYPSLTRTTTSHARLLMPLPRHAKMSPWWRRLRLEED